MLEGRTYMRPKVLSYKDITDKVVVRKMMNGDIRPRNKRSLYDLHFQVLQHQAKDETCNADVRYVVSSSLFSLVLISIQNHLAHTIITLYATFAWLAWYSESRKHEDRVVNA